jgi:hypothetical protein
VREEVVVVVVHDGKWCVMYVWRWRLQGTFTRSRPAATPCRWRTGARMSARGWRSSAAGHSSCCWAGAGLSRRERALVCVLAWAG